MRMRVLRNSVIWSGLFVWPCSLFAESLTLVEFLALQKQQNYQTWQLEVQQRAQQLGLEVGEEYWKPSITAISSAQNSKNTTAGKTLGYEQWQAGIETSWTSDIGTDVSLAANWLDGEGLGSVALSERQTGRDVTFTISQPLLKNNSPEFRRLDKYLAQNNWRQYKTQKVLSGLEIQRDSLQGFIEFQVAYENWKIQTDLLKSQQHTARITEQMMRAEKATPYEVEKAQAEVLEQQVEVHSAQVEMSLLEQEALSTLRMNESLSLQPFTSLTQLLEQLHPLMASKEADDLLSHPELTEAELSYGSSLLQFQKEEQALRPDLDVFYQHQKQHLQKSSDVENNTYGIRFSYELTNKSTQQRIEALSAAADVAELEKLQANRRLKLSYHTLYKRADYLIKQVDVLAHQVDLAKKGLEQQRSRYKVGRASFYSLENVQQDVLDKQQEWLSALRSLATVMSQLSYYTQSNIGKMLTDSQYTRSDIE